MDPSDHVITACPDWQHWKASLDNAAKGQVLPWRIAFLPLPGWVFWVLFNWIAPWTWGRTLRRAANKNPMSALLDEPANPVAGGPSVGVEVLGDQGKGDVDGA